MNKWLKYLIGVLAVFVVLAGATCYFFLRKLGEAYKSECDTIHEWKIEGYTIVERRCIGWAGPPYYPSFLYKNGELIDQGVVGRDSCIFRFKINEKDILEFNVCDSTLDFYEDSGRKENKETVFRYTTADADILIFSEVYCRESPYYGNCFSPSKSEVDTCEYHLKNSIRYFGTSAGSHSLKEYGWDTIYNDLSSYKRQYVGYKDSTGTRFLHVIAIHREVTSTLPAWGSKLYFFEVYGENKRWEVRFNLDQKKIIEIGGT